MIRWARAEEARSDFFVNFCREHAVIPHAGNVNRYWEYPWGFCQSALRSGMRVLDAGAGNSPFLFHLGQRVPGCEFHAADPSFRYQQPAQLSDVAVSAQPVESLEYPSEYFDVSFCLSVLEHLPEDQQLDGMRQLARCTRPGGRLVLTVDFFLDWPSWHEARERNPHWRAWLPGDGNVDVAALVQASGLVPLDQNRLDMHPGQEGFHESALDPASLWSSTHVGPELRVTALGVVLYKPLGAEGPRLTVSPEALHLRDDGTPLLGLHRGVMHETPARQYVLPREALHESGFSPGQFLAWIGEGAQARETLDEALRWGALRPVANAPVPASVYQPQSFVEHYGGRSHHATRRTVG